MEALLMFLFMGLVFAGLYSILNLGYRSIEAERAKAEAAQAQEVLQEPRFFAKTIDATPAEAAPIVPAHLVAMLEQQLQRDYAGAERFARQPSMERICNGYDAYVDAVAGDLERRIQQDSAATSAFVAKPSVEGLLSEQALQ